MNVNQNITIEFFQKMLLAFMNMEYPIVKGLVGANRVFRRSFLKKVIKDMHQKVSGGMSISQSISGYDGYFSPLFQKIVEIGEKSGSLPSLINQYLKVATTTNRINKQVKMLCIQPVITLFVASFVIIIAIFTSIPLYEKFFTVMDAPIPWVLRSIMWVTSGIRTNLATLLFIISVLLIIFVVYREKLDILTGADRVIYHLPIFSKVYQLAAQIRWTEILRLLLLNGESLPEAIKFAGQGSGFTEYEHKSNHIADRIERGESLQICLIHKILPVSMINILLISEQKGLLIEGLQNISDFLTTEMETSSRETITKINVVISLFMGFIVGSLLIMLYMPIFLAPQIIV